MISLLRCCISRPYLAICLVSQLPAIILAASQRGSCCLNIHTPANSSLFSFAAAAAAAAAVSHLPIPMGRPQRSSAATVMAPAAGTPLQ
jgi:hypothetical protein